VAPLLSKDLPLPPIARLDAECAEPAHLAAGTRVLLEWLLHLDAQLDLA
jgi:hypothetical protein